VADEKAPSRVKLSKADTVPVLPSPTGGRWVNLTEAGEILGITRQHSYKRATTNGFKTLHRIGNKPSFVVDSTELDQINEAVVANGHLSREEEALGEET